MGVGCEEAQDTKGSGYRAPVWYSLPGVCPELGMQNTDIDANKATQDVNSFKTDECKQRMPGGRCQWADTATGQPECTYHLEFAGEVMLDELVGITGRGVTEEAKYNDWWNMSYSDCLGEVANGLQSGPCVQNKEYEELTDKGIGTTFWDNRNDEAACEARIEAAQRLFAINFPEFPETLPEPACDFDMFYDGELTWPVNHTGAPHSSWWVTRVAI